MPGERDVAPIKITKEDLESNTHIRHELDTKHRYPFGIPVEIQSSEQENYLLNLRIATAVFKRKYQGDNQRAEFGSAMGKMMVHALEELDIHDKPTLEQLSKLRSLRGYYQKILGEDFELIYSGSLAEFAVMKGLSDQLNTHYGSQYADHLQDIPRIEYPYNQEDTQHGVDFWLNMGSEKDLRIGFQVKCLGRLDETMANTVHRIDHVLDVEQLFNRYEGRKRVKSEGDEWPEYEIKGSLKRLNTIRRPHVAAGVILVASPDSNYAGYNSLHGVPSRDFSHSLYSQIQELYINKAENKS